MDAVTVAGLRISYRRTGSGEPVLLLHGAFGLDSRFWEPQLDDLGDEFDVIAWDAPGCGGSDDAPDGFSLGDYAECVVGFVAALGLARPHVVGLSFGGALAIAVCARHPVLPASLVLVGAYAGWAGSLPADELRRRIGQATQDAARPVEEWLPGYVPGMLTASASPELAERTLALMSGLRPRPGLTMLRAMAEADYRAVLPSIRVPTLVLHGELDARSPLAVGRELHARMPGSRLVVLPGVGHLVNLQAPEAFDREVRTFLRSTREAGGP